WASPPFVRTGAPSSGRRDVGGTAGDHGDSRAPAWRAQSRCGGEVRKGGGPPLRAPIVFLLNEALRDLRRAGRVGVSAILLIALSLAALGGFWLLSLNLGRAVTQWRDRGRIIAYLREERPAGPRG